MNFPGVHDRIEFPVTFSLKERARERERERERGEKERVQLVKLYFPHLRGY